MVKKGQETLPTAQVDNIKGDEGAVHPGGLSQENEEKPIAEIIQVKAL